MGYTSNFRIARTRDYCTPSRPMNETEKTIRSKNVESPCVCVEQVRVHDSRR